MNPPISTDPTKTISEMISNPAVTPAKTFVSETTEPRMLAKL